LGAISVFERGAGGVHQKGIALNESGTALALKGLMGRTHRLEINGSNPVARTTVPTHTHNERRCSLRSQTSKLFADRRKYSELKTIDAATGLMASRLEMGSLSEHSSSTRAKWHLQNDKESAENCLHRCTWPSHFRLFLVKP
jgi:hypothetical protein